MGGLRIGFVTQWYTPEPVQVPRATARGLQARGHEVHVVTGFPNYPSGQLAPGYRIRPYQRELIDDVVVHRSPLVPSHDASALNRMVNYLSFGAAASAVAALKVPPVDVWLSHHSPVTAVVPALVRRRAAALRRRPEPVTQIIQDLWPDSVTDSGFVSNPKVASAMESVLHAFCRWTYRGSAAVGVISPGMREVMVARGVPAARVFDTPNWMDVPVPPSRAIGSLRRLDLGLPVSGTLFLYAGNLGEMQNLGPLVDAFAQVPQAQLVLMGNGVQRDALTQQVASLGASNVHLLPPVGPDEVPAYLHAADVTIVSLQDTPLLRVTMPSKTQANLAAGRAMLVHGAGDAADVVERAGAGRGVSPARPDAVVAAIRELADASSEQLDEYGRRARAHFEEHYAPDVALDAMEAMLRYAVEHPEGSRGCPIPLAPLPKITRR